MLTELLQVSLIISILATAVRMGTIVLLGALGELVAERSGVLNLSVEGMMLFGAFFGFLGAYYTESLWLGVLFAALAGLVVSAIFAVLAVLLQIDQTVSGLAVNITPALSAWIICCNTTARAVLWWGIWFLTRYPIARAVHRLLQHATTASRKALSPTTFKKVSC